MTGEDKGLQVKRLASVHQPLPVLLGRRVFPLIPLAEVPFSISSRPDWAGGEEPERQDGREGEGGEYCGANDDLAHGRLLVA